MLTCLSLLGSSAFVVAFDVAGKSTTRSAHLMESLLKFRCVPSNCHALRKFLEEVPANVARKGPEAMKLFFDKIADAARLLKDGKMSPEAYKSFSEVITQLGKTVQKAGPNQGKAILAVQRGATHVVRDLETVAKKIAGGDNFKITRFEEKVNIKGLGDRFYDITIEANGKIFRVEMKSWSPELFKQYMEGSLKGLSKLVDEKLPGQMSKDLLDSLFDAGTKANGSKIVLDRNGLGNIKKRWGFDSRMAEAGVTTSRLADDVLEIFSDNPLLKKRLLSGLNINVAKVGNEAVDDFFSPNGPLKDVLKTIFVL